MTARSHPSPSPSPSRTGPPAPTDSARPADDRSGGATVSTLNPPRPCTAAAGLPLPSLLETTPAALAQLACILATRSELWRPLLHVDPERRWYARVAGGEGWEAWLLTWLPGQRTGLHDHGGSAGAFTVLSGEVEEQVFVPGPGAGLRAARYRSPDVRAFSGDHVHEVRGVSATPAATLHVYSPALTTMRDYQVDQQRGLLPGSTRRAGVDW